MLKQANNATAGANPNVQVDDFYFWKVHDQTEVNWTGHICDFLKYNWVFPELNSV